MSESSLDDELSVFMHVLQVGVEILGWIGVVLNCLTLIGGLVSQSPTSILSAFLSILVYSGLIVAKRASRHQWYLPFLVINVSL